MIFRDVVYWDCSLDFLKSLLFLKRFCRVVFLFILKLLINEMIMCKILFNKYINLLIWILNGYFKLVIVFGI